MEIAEIKFRNNIMVTGVTQILIVFCQFLISIILARGLSVQGRGVFSLALLVPGLFLTFVSFGLGESTAYLLGKDRYPRDKIIGCLNLYLLLLVGISALIYYSLAQLILDILNHNIGKQLFYISFLIMPISLCWGGYASVLLAFGKVKQVGVGRLVNNLLFLFLCLILFNIFKPIPQIAIIILILAGMMEIFFVLHFIKKYTKIGFCFNKKIMKDQIRFGLKYFLGGVFANISRRMDAVFVNFFIGTYGLGIYAIAVGLNEFLLNIPNVFCRVAFSSAVVSSDNKSFSIATKSIRQSMFLLVISAIPLGLFLKYIINVFYTTKFAEALIPGLVLLPGIIVFGLSMIISYNLTGYGKPEEGTKAMGISCIFTIILDLLLIPRFGIVGASLASTISYAGGTIYLLIVYKRFSQRSISEILLIKKEDIREYFSELHRLTALIKSKI
jgi:O-antigen/teichoic acid export membrane protein